MEQTADKLLHSTEEHKRRLDVLCRVCGERNLRQTKDKGRNAILCVNYADKLLLRFDLDVSCDEEGKHPPCICYKCYRKMLNEKRAQSKTTNKDVSISIERMSNVWTEFDPNLSLTQCSSCAYFQTKGQGGRPKKRPAPVKRPIHQSFDEQSDLDVSADDSLSASFCQSTSTPAKQPRTLFTQTSPIRTHRASVTDAALSPFAQLKRKTVFLDSDDEDLDKPLTDQEEKLLTRLVKRKLKQSSDGLTVRCKTRGQPLVLKRVAQARKPSTLASSPQKKNGHALFRKSD